jgi:hypothetical protein
MDFFSNTLPFPLPLDFEASKDHTFILWLGLPVYCHQVSLNSPDLPYPWYFHFSPSFPHHHTSIFEVADYFLLLLVTYLSVSPGFLVVLPPLLPGFPVLFLPLSLLRLYYVRFCSDSSHSWSPMEETST